MVVFRPEAPDRDWSLLRVISADHEADAIAALRHVFQEHRGAGGPVPGARRITDGPPIIDGTQTRS